MLEYQLSRLIVFVNLFLFMQSEHIRPKEWPCPSDAEFVPCLCWEDEELHLHADCSLAKNDEELQNAFQANFPFNDFIELIIDQSDCTDCHLNILQQSTFGDINFVDVIIGSTSITTVGNSAFQNSENTLINLNLKGNNISSFNFEVLNIFTSLNLLNLDSNNLGDGFPVNPITSNSLEYLYLSNNPDIQFTYQLVSNCPLLLTLEIKNAAVSKVPMQITGDVGMFVGLRNILRVDFSHNNIFSMEKLVVQADDKTLQYVSFAHNNISEIHSKFITGFESQGQLDFSHNAVRLLPEDVWAELLMEVSALNLAGNPLLCGCDIAWIVRDPPLLAKLSQDTTCSDNVTVVNQLTPEIFEQCDQ